MRDSEVKKRSRDESEEADSDIDSPEVKRLRDGLLDGLDEETELYTMGFDLDSFMKSFENDITAGGDELATVEDLKSDPGESRPNLGYLLEASDDDLGLPPTEAFDFGADLWGFEAEVPGYDPRGFGFIQTEVFDGEYAMIDRLFDYSDMDFGYGGFMWRRET
ncbi:uncharacterized protein [Primulina huaijiensis]|uniref:uncharacterized protein n=1 Tax=Primulina huaijiensis TaxID=1492673 RepID=UPI003CC72D95